MSLAEYGVGHERKGLSGGRRMGGMDNEVLMHKDGERPGHLLRERLYLCVNN